MDRQKATKLLLNSAFPMLIPDVQDAYAASHAKWKGPPGNHKIAFDLLSEYYEHFEDMNFFMLGKRLITIPSKKSTVDGTFAGVATGDINDENSAISQDHIDAMVEMLQEFVDTKIALDKMPHAEFLQVYEPLRRKTADLMKANAEKYDELQFYSFPEAQANWEYWLQQPCWSLEEATALCFGKDPDVVSFDTLKTLRGAGESIFVKSYLMLRRQILKANASDQLQDPVNQKQFVDWAQRNNVAVQLPHLDKSLGGNAPHAITKCFEEPMLSEEEIRTQAVHSLYRIVLGIIIARYGSVADPHDIQRQADKYEDVFSDIRRIGISLDRGTLVKYLDRAYDYARRKHLFDAASGKPMHSRKT